MKMSKRYLVFFVVLLAALGISATVVLGADMFSGTWKMNVAKSKFTTPAPKSGTSKIEAVDGGLKIVADGENAEGKKTHTEYTLKFDGKDYPDKVMLDGKIDPNGADMISGKKIDDNTWETVTKLKGKVLVTARSVISKDGKTRTLTQTGKDGQGRTVNNTAIYEKQ